MTGILGKHLAGHTLALETSAANFIDNGQVREVSVQETNLFKKFETDFGAYVVVRSEPNPLYNCHGLTFAARRTWISRDDALQLILSDDGYIEITKDEAMAGDVILYVDGQEIIHSGIVIQAAKDSLIGLPRVISKWGKWSECIHYSTASPYQPSVQRYFRIK